MNRDTLEPLPAPPATWLLGSRVRAVADRLIRRRWHVTVRNVERVPTNGPVIFVANHIGFMDGPLMAIVGPRPVHALTKQEMFDGALGPLLRAAGQIRLDRFAVDVAAVRSGASVLASGGALGMFPEGTRGAGLLDHTLPGAAYLAMIGGATIVPMAFLGTRLPGGSNSSIPPGGSPMVVSYGEPFVVSQSPWPRRRDDVRRNEDRIDEAIRSAAAEAVAATGIDLPGPLPSESKDDR